MACKHFLVDEQNESMILKMSRVYFIYTAPPELKIQDGM